MDGMQPDNRQKDENYQKAKKRLEEVKGFYFHLGIFLIINVMLVLTNLITSPGSWWFYWVTLFWGVGLAFHGAGVFGKGRGFSRKWEEEKIRQYMNEEESKR